MMYFQFTYFQSEDYVKVVKINAQAKKQTILFSMHTATLAPSKTTENAFGVLCMLFM